MTWLYTSQAGANALAVTSVSATWQFSEQPQAGDLITLTTTELGGASPSVAVPLGFTELATSFGRQFAYKIADGTEGTTQSSGTLGSAQNMGFWATLFRDNEGRTLGRLDEANSTSGTPASETGDVTISNLGLSYVEGGKYPKLSVNQWVARETSGLTVIQANTSITGWSQYAHGGSTQIGGISYWTGHTAREFSAGPLEDYSVSVNVTPNSGGAWTWASYFALFDLSVPADPQGAAPHRAPRRVAVRDLPFTVTKHMLEGGRGA